MTDSLKDKVNDAYVSGRGKADEALRSAKTKASEAASKARTKTNEVTATAKAKSAEAIAATRNTARVVAEKANSGFDDNPLIAVIGGLAIGAIAAALLPRTAREDAVVGSVGDKVRKTATDAIKTARDTGKEQLDALGITSGAAKNQLRDTIGKIAKAVTSAAEAAGESIKKR